MLTTWRLMLAAATAVTTVMMKMMATVAVTMMVMAAAAAITEEEMSEDQLIRRAVGVPMALDHKFMYLSEGENNLAKSDNMVKTTEEVKVPLQVVPLQVLPHHKETRSGFSDIYFVVLVAGCGVAGFVALVTATACLYKVRTNNNAAKETPYSPGPSHTYIIKKDKSLTNCSGKDPPYGLYPTLNGDSALAISAQKFNFRHEKEKQIALEKGQSEVDQVGNGALDNADDVYEIPGPGSLSMWDVVVDNPTFTEDDTPASAKDYTLPLGIEQDTAVSTEEVSPASPEGNTPASTTSTPINEATINNENKLNGIQILNNNEDPSENSAKTSSLQNPPLVNSSPTDFTPEEQPTAETSPTVNGQNGHNGHNGINGINGHLSEDD